MADTQRDLADCVGAIYEAAANGGSWLDVGQRLCSLLDAQRAYLRIGPSPADCAQRADAARRERCHLRGPFPRPESAYRAGAARLHRGPHAAPAAGAGRHRHRAGRDLPAQRVLRRLRAPLRAAPPARRHGRRRRRDAGRRVPRRGHAALRRSGAAAAAGAAAAPAERARTAHAPGPRRAVGLADACGARRAAVRRGPGRCRAEDRLRQRGGGQVPGRHRRRSVLDPFRPPCRQRPVPGRAVAGRGLDAAPPGGLGHFGRPGRVDAGALARRQHGGGAGRRGAAWPDAGPGRRRPGGPCGRRAGHGDPAARRSPRRAAAGHAVRAVRADTRRGGRGRGPGGRRHRRSRWHASAACR